MTGLWIGTELLDYCHTFGIASWKTPSMFGNSGRSPIYPYMYQPFSDDYEDLLHFYRDERTRRVELITTYRLMQQVGFVHPQREASDYAVIQDAEFMQDI